MKQNYWQQHREYLHSPEWTARKIEYALTHPPRCANCATRTGPLHLHHLSYDHEPGTEPDKDLMLLCPECHTDKHSDI